MQSNVEIVQEIFPLANVRIGDDDKLRVNVPELSTSEIAMLAFRTKSSVKRSGTGLIILVEEILK